MKVLKDNLIKYEQLSCNKDYSNKIDEELKTWFKNTFKFPKNDINKFILLLRKGVYPYECLDDWKNSVEQNYLKRKNLNNLKMEDITNADYMHAKRACKVFEIKKLGEYHDLCL